MNILDILEILRQSWRLILAITVLSAIASLVIALRQPPSYTANVRFLLTIADPYEVDIEDALAYDVATIIHGRLFTEDLSEALAAQGFQYSPSELRTALSATNTKRDVTLTATGTDAQATSAMISESIRLIERWGLYYWSKAAPISRRPGMTIVYIDMLEAATQHNTRSAIAREVGLRTFAALWLACVLAFAQRSIINNNVFRKN